MTNKIFNSPSRLTSNPTNNNNFNTNNHSSFSKTPNNKCSPSSSNNRTIHKIINNIYINRQIPNLSTMMLIKDNQWSKECPHNKWFNSNKYLKDNLYISKVQSYRYYLINQIMLFFLFSHQIQA